MGLVGCEGDGGLGAPILSELQGLPVPENAEIAARDAGTANAPILVYRVPGATHEQLKRWYAREMPVGRDWQGWSWCDSEENESGFFRYYHRPGEALLSVNPGAGRRDPPGLHHLRSLLRLRSPVPGPSPLLPLPPLLLPPGFATAKARTSAASSMSFSVGFPAP